ncbi:c-type cytochrome [uncultured Brevundimonas sp.]|uniref:c-type cytochrome n=1 Tax=uncultured Brevundimonas sp. TaxID=213418 RepID=UPI0025D9D523|nr:c-type cytochrome [uncultured Brevundimonas sp.]
MQTGEYLRTKSGLLLMVPIFVLLSACADKRQQPRDITGADAAAGLAVIERLGCAACHQIPGVDWPQGTVGGSLDGFADRSMIAGQFPNQPETLATWVRNAPSMSPKTGMPAMPMTSAEARDVAAYLYTLEHD